MKKILVAMLIACMILSVASVALAAFKPITNERTGDDYTKLEDALAAAAAGDTIRLNTDITLTTGLIVPSGMTVTLDLNGYTVSMEKACTEHFAMITNKGTMTIDDSFGGGAISFTDTGSGDPEYGWGSYTVRNEGTLTLENGTIENNSNIATGVSYALDVQGGSVTMNGGSVICDNKVAIRQFSTGTVTINDGEVTGSRGIWLQAAGSDTSVAPTMTLNVNGGTITNSNESDLAIYCTSNGNSLKNVKINITGGKITGWIGLTGGTNKTACETVNISGGDIFGVYSYSEDQEMAMETITITGGTFSDFGYTDYYCSDDGYMCVENSSGEGYEYIVVPAVSISFDANGGTGIMEDYEQYPAGEYTLPDNGFTAPEGKQFKGWQINGTGNYAAGTVVELNEDATITAIWEDIPAQAPAAPTAPVAPAPKTGDNTNIALWMALMAISAVALVGLRKKAKASK